MHLLHLLPLLPLATAWSPPSYPDLALIWADTFPGSAGSLPNEGNWNILDGNLGVNNELQTYRRSSRTAQISGGTTLQLVPWRDGSVSGGWISGRVESKYTFTPAAGRRTVAEAVVRFGGNGVETKQGVWPAFWMLGDSIRKGTPWPACGELDVLETVNGVLTGYGTMHCNTSPGGICNEPNGRGSSVGIPNQDWQRWRIVWDRAPGDWRSETITWFMNDAQFHQISGSQIGDAGVWASVAASPLFFILNVAVGGNWPGYPNGNTLDGYGAMMEVGYVAHYSS
ncbi:concanavalin A-like lectin/glucanase domain-containing protein [Staphylotrichum tortipilum]|uniref:Concanavalin A-like lectin/glucanase domain-containing protein n=1 Tax=Staphylotrichum tortipilum TaxID=2831512 RepID=A0AAN6RVS0_9PEZI|nr:concanavalin A-like lectin/glucanase domain-containing protein [Staphylotrichum longicolle]